MKFDSIIDLSMSIEPEMRRFPGMPGPTLVHTKTHAKQGLQVTRLETLVHMGTHVDAPLHMIATGESVDHMPLHRLMGEAVVIDLTHKSPGSAVTPEELDLSGSDIRTGDIVILNTGYARIPDPKHFCWLQPDAAQWLVERGILCLGVDIPSLDPMAPPNTKASWETHPAHHIILGNGIPLVECLVNLNAIMGRRIFFCCLPLKIAGSDGAPGRAVAMELT